MDLGGRNLGDDCVLGKSRTSHEVKDLLSVFGQPRGSVRHESLALCASDLGTQVGLVALTVNAVVAGTLGSIARDNDISDGNRGNVGPDGFHNGSSFMSRNTITQIIVVFTIFTQMCEREF